MSEPSELTLRDWLEPQLDAINLRITELKGDWKERLDYHEQLLTGNGQEGVIQRSVRADGNAAEALKLVGAANRRIDRIGSGDKKTASKWGAIAGILTGLPALLAAIASVVERQQPK